MTAPAKVCLLLSQEHLSCDGGEHCDVYCFVVTGSALISGDNYGRLKLVRYPCPDSDAMPKFYYGHSGAIRRVRWAANDTHIISIGGKDRGLLVWKIVRDKDDESTPHGKEANVRNVCACASVCVCDSYVFASPRRTPTSRRSFLL